VAEGIGFVLCDPTLRALLLRAGTMEFFGAFFAALYALYAIRTLGIAPGWVGGIIGVGGIGSLVGAALAPRVARRFGIGRTLVAMAFAPGLVGFLVPLAHGPAWKAASFLMAGQLLGDGLWTIYNVTEISLRQSRLPDRLMGRANAGFQCLTGATGPLGAVVSGALAEGIGLRGTLLVAVVGMLLSTLWIYLSPIRGMESSRMHTGVPF
jgi:MFS family permease